MSNINVADQKRLVAEGRAIEKKSEAGLSKLTNDIIAIVGLFLALIAFGFAIWAAWWAIQANNRATAQGQQFAAHTNRFLETIETQTSRIDELVDRVDRILPPPPLRPLRPAPPTTSGT